MSEHKDKDLLEEEDILEEMEDEIEELENEEWEIDEEKVEEAMSWQDNEVIKLKDALARQQADFINFKTRTERDKSDMIFFLKQDIFKKILPRIDDIERIIKNTPEDLCNGVIYDGVLSLEKTLKKDLKDLWVEWFNSIWEEVNPDIHDVMTTIPWKPEGIIVDEFEKWYTLSDKVLRPAKVVVWAWE